MVNGIILTPSISHQHGSARKKRSNKDSHHHHVARSLTPYAMNAISKVSTHQYTPSTILCRSRKEDHAQTIVTCNHYVRTAMQSNQQRKVMETKPNNILYSQTWTGRGGLGSFSHQRETALSKKFVRAES